MADIGFIGLGHMGVPMVRRLIEADHEVVIHGRHPDVVRSLTALGARAVASPKEVADHDIAAGTRRREALQA